MTHVVQVTCKSCFTNILSLSITSHQSVAKVPQKNIHHSYVYRVHHVHFLSTATLLYSEVGSTLKPLPLRADGFHCPKEAHSWDWRGYGSPGGCGKAGEWGPGVAGISGRRPASGCSCTTQPANYIIHNITINYSNSYIFWLDIN